MKRFNVFVVLLAVLTGCKGQGESKEASGPVQEEEATLAYASFGEKIADAKAKDASEMLRAFQAIAPKDSVEAKFRATVKEVCQNKGCWMKLELANGEETMVKFKDYGFFVPKDISGKEVVVSGMAFVNEMGVDEQRHYAEDAGATPAEIEKITDPKRTFGFEANGVLVAQ
ncbi:DUF4920 domain-containing protein [Maribacter sp. 2307ULW6-5]|uniref:DUF4920 domain-containing protein n=1 Tax=Maribacter sp. 2307ULW6-5 TaxID=3386275 RepID=UPI0039BCE546